MTKEFEMVKHLYNITKKHQFSYIEYEVSLPLLKETAKKLWFYNGPIFGVTQQEITEVNKMFEEWPL